MIQKAQTCCLTETAFLDEKTEQSVAFDSVWRMILPLHELGSQWKRSIQPFLPGEEHQYSVQVEWIDQFIRYAKNHPDWMEACCTVLRKLPPIQAVLNLLHNKVVLQTADCFTLKQWLLYTKQLCLLLGQVFTEVRDHHKVDQADDHEETSNKGYVGQSAFVQLDTYKWDDWLQILDPSLNQSTSFSLSDLQDTRLEDLERRRIGLEQERIRHTLQQAKRIFEQTGIRPNRNQQVYVSKLPIAGGTDGTKADNASIVERCYQCEDLHYLMETRDEIIFQVEADKAMESLQEAMQLLQMQIDTYQRELLARLSSSFWEQASEIIQASLEVGKVDYFLAVVRIALEWDTWCWGELQHNSSGENEDEDACNCTANSPAMQIKQGWHPLFRKFHEQHNKVRGWTRLSLDLGKVNVLTGPNMGGKSVTLKTIGLFQILFQYGLPVPAEYFSSSFAWWVRYHGGDDSNEQAGLSSFGAELIRLSDVLRLPGKGLLLLDEVARSTNPEEGEALATAIVEHARESDNVTMCASHFSRVGQVPNTTRFQVKGLQTVPESWKNVNANSLAPEMSIQDVLYELQQRMDYEVIPVIEGEVPQYALTIAGILGLSKPIIERGFELLAQQKLRNKN